MNFKKVLLWGALGGAMGGIIVFFIFSFSQKLKIEIGSLADWIMIFVTGLTIYFGFKGIQMEIEDQNLRAKRDALTYFSYANIVKLSNQDIFLHDKKIDLKETANSWEDGTVLEDSKALPFFKNVGTRVAMNVSIVFTFDFMDKKTHIETFQYGLIGPGKKVIVVPKEWLTMSDIFTIFAKKIELYYTTTQEDRVCVTWLPTKRKIGEAPIYIYDQDPKVDFKRESQAILKQERNDNTAFSSITPAKK